MTNELFTKQNVSFNEYYIQRIVYDQHCVNVPKVISYDSLTKTMQMRKVPQMSIADMYGDKNKDTPDELYEKIRTIMIQLREIGINYPDITAYNFIECGDLVWIIDFGDASIRKHETDPFMLKFIQGYNGWNDDYR